MKIPLNVGHNDSVTGKAAIAKALEHDLAASQKGDWDARNRITQSFMPFITSMVRKRTSDNAAVVKYVDAAKLGVIRAIQQYKPAMGVEKFQVMALDAMEESMKLADKPPSWFARLFGGRE